MNVSRILDFIKKRPKLTAFGVSVALSLACPYLPGPFPGPCRLVASALRTGIFDGTAIPWNADDCGTCADGGT